MRTHTSTYSADIAITFNHNKRNNFLDAYYDDEGWSAITWIKAYDLTHRSVYLNMAKTIFNIKNLYYLYQSDPKRAYRVFITRNADALWAHDRDSSNHLGLHWDGPFDFAQARRQSSGIDAFNAAITLSGRFHHSEQ